MLPFVLQSHLVSIMAFFLVAEDDPDDADFDPDYGAARRERRIKVFYTFLC